MKKLIRITTVPQSLRGLLKGQLKFMKAHGYEVLGVSSPGEALEDVAKNEAVEVYPVRMTREITPIADLKALVKLYFLFRREKPSFVHSHTPKAGLLGMLAARIAGIPHRLHTVAGMPLTVATGKRRVLLTLIEKITYSCATKIYPNSNGLKEFIVLNKLAVPKKIKVIGKGSSNGIDTSEFDPVLVSETERNKLRQSLGIAKEDFVFLFVGRVVTDKGVNELVKAFNNLYNSRVLLSKGEKFHLVIVGPFEKDLDPINSETERIISENSNIQFVGFQANVVEYFAMADVLTLPSYREGFPNVVMQAAAMQLNCIVSDINGCNEIVKDGDNGWLVKPKNVKDLENRMLWCLNNRNESKKMGQKSRTIMEIDFERKYVQSELLKEYNNLLNIRK